MVLLSRSPLVAVRYDQKQQTPMRLVILNMRNSSTRCFDYRIEPLVKNLSIWCVQKLVLFAFVLSIKFKMNRSGINIYCFEKYFTRSAFFGIVCFFKLQNIENFTIKSIYIYRKQRFILNLLKIFIRQNLISEC